MRLYPATSALTAVMLSTLAPMGLALAASPTLTPQQQGAWSAWRGPDGSGVAAGSPATEWSEDKNIKWKTALPGLGLSTPVSWGDRLYMTTAVRGEKADGSKGAADTYDFRVICVDRRDGSIVWTKSVANVVPHAKVHPTNSQASNSPVTDGERIYAHFGSRGLYCLDMAGKELWSKQFGEMSIKFSFGEGCSPALVDDRLIINWDHDGDSFICALNKKTGKELWRKERDEASTWATPLIIEDGGTTVAIVPASDRSRAYNVKNGKVVWEVGGLTSNVIPSPVIFNDVVFLMSGYQGTALQAINFKGAKGDLDGGKRVLWRHNRQTPYVPSGLVYDGRLYFLRNYHGVLSCLDAETGEVHYEGQRLKGVRQVYASPVGAGGHVYVLSRGGKTKVIKASDKYEQVATNVLDDEFDASPVVIGDDLYLRGRAALYCISEQD